MAGMQSEMIYATDAATSDGQTQNYIDKPHYTRI